VRLWQVLGGEEDPAYVPEDEEGTVLFDERLGQARRGLPAPGRWHPDEGGGMTLRHPVAPLAGAPSASNRPAWCIIVLGHPPSPNRRWRGLARRRRVQPIADSIYLQARRLGLPEPLRRARIALTLVYEPGAPWRDPDNAIASCKVVLDTLVRAGLIVDDGPNTISLGLSQRTGLERALLVEIAPGGRAGGGAHG